MLAAALQRTALGFQERLIEASLGGSPASSLRRADVELTKLRFYLRLAHDLELLTGRQYAHASKTVDEVGRLLGGWRKAQGRGGSREE